MKSLMRYRGLLVIALWQAPIGTDEEGRTRLGFGFGAGTLEYESLTCGEPPAYSRIGYKQVGTEVEHFSGRRTRLHGAAGVQWSDSSSSTGPFGAFTIGYEGRHFGIGGGIALVPAVTSTAHDSAGREFKSSTTVAAPSVSVRLGNHEKVHVRAQMYPPSVNSAAEALRVVVGYNQFSTRRPSFSIGYALIHENAAESAYPGIVAEWMQPITPRAALGLHGFSAAGKEHRNSGVTAQVKFTVN